MIYTSNIAAGLNSLHGGGGGGGAVRINTRNERA